MYPVTNLPTSRNRTYGASSPIISADLDDIQDCIIATKKASSTRVFYPNYLGLVGTAPTLSGGAQQEIITAAGTSLVSWGAPSEVGDRVTSYDVDVFGNGVTDTIFTISLFNRVAGTLTVLGTVTDNNRAAAWGRLTVALTPHVMAVGDMINIDAQPNGAAYRISRNGLTYDRL